jgi:hypothetical protein
MKHRNHGAVLALLIIASLLLSACSQSSAEATHEKPAHLEEIEGSDFKRVVLTEKAAERLDIQMAKVSAEEGKMIVPYSTIIYGLNGETWLYTSPEKLTYVRHPIAIDRIEGSQAFLSDGPDLGTDVVTVGVVELYGEETGIKK